MGVPVKILRQDEAPQEVGLVGDEVELALHRLQELAAKGQTIIAYWESPFFAARLEAALERGVIRSQSPWLDREAAAAYAHCCPAEIDRAARTLSHDGKPILRKRERGGAPMYWKSEIDEAIESGRWVPGKPSKRK